ncbi:MAG: hypothetical protein CR978_00110 [Gammaproteobacteria bacterium]|nr:MAG: hypothetical protein CR978_00110 [Gammaproteobacteria bacterium]
MKKVGVALGLLVLLAALVVYQRSQQHRSETTFNIATAAIAEVSKTILASGNMRFDTQLELRSELIGVVSRVYVKQGDRVARGELLLELDKTLFRARFEQVSSTVAVQKTAIARLDVLLTEDRRKERQLRKLFDKNVLDQDSLSDAQNKVKLRILELEGAKYRLKQLQAELAQAEDSLAKTEFRAPEDALVITVGIKPGETVIPSAASIPGSSLVTLAKADSYIARLRVDEADLEDVSSGHGVYYPVDVRLVGAAPFYPGMSCRAEIVVSAAERTVAVPIAAILQDDKGAYVWSVKNNTAKRQAITLGVSSDVSQQALTGIAAGEAVIVGPARHMAGLEDGQTIAVNTPGGAQ